MICYLRRDLIAVMRKQLKFRPEIVTATRKTFKRVAKKMKVPVKKLTFVGVHNRFVNFFFWKFICSPNSDGLWSTLLTSG